MALVPLNQVYIVANYREVSLAHVLPGQHARIHVDAYNLDLSDKRAHSVQKYLEDKGVDAKRLTAQGYGETQPLDRNHNEKAWAKNRRVAFLILKRASD